MVHSYGTCLNLRRGARWTIFSFSLTDFFLSSLGACLQARHRHDMQLNFERKLHTCRRLPNKLNEGLESLGRAITSYIFYLLRSYSQAYSPANSLPPSPTRAQWNATPISQAIHMHWNKRKWLHKKGGLVWYTNIMPAVSLFRNGDIRLLWRHVKTLYIPVYNLQKASFRFQSFTAPLSYKKLVSQSSLQGQRVSCRLHAGSRVFFHQFAAWF